MNSRNNNSTIQLLNFNDMPVQYLTDGQGDPWFIAKDICHILGYMNARDALYRHVDSEDKGVVKRDTLGGAQNVSIINESGLYSLVLSSKMPNARKFKHWVTSEVLPSIRKHDTYMTPQTLAESLNNPQTVITILEQLKAEQELRLAHEQQLAKQEAKVLFADAVSASDNTCLVGELAKMIYQARKKNGWAEPNIGQNRLLALLRDDGYLGKSGSNKNVPLQKYIEQGLFKVKETAVTHADGHVTLTRTPKVTGKGQTYFIKRYAHKGGENQWVTNRY